MMIRLLPSGVWPVGFACLAGLGLAGCPNSAPTEPCIPRGAEICNGIDDDCDGRTDNVLVIVSETCNGIDDDCNGLTDEDVVPTTEVCNGRDDDCNGLTDDGVTVGPEVCNGLDDDCDGAIDEGVFGVVSGPWLFAADLPVGSFDDPGSVAVLSDGRILITWVPWEHDYQARYVIVNTAGEVLRSETLLPYPAEDVGAVAVGGSAHVFVSTGSVGSSPIEPHMHTIHRVVVANDGTPGTPREVWTSAGAYYFLDPFGGTAVGGDVILATSEWKDRDPTGARVHLDTLTLIRVQPDGAVAGIWPEPPATLSNQFGTFAVVPSGAFRALWLEVDGTASVMHAGRGDSPFGGPTFLMRGRPPDPHRAIVPFVHRIGEYSRSLVAFDDRFVAGFGSAFGDDPPLGAQPLGTVVAEYGFHGDHYRVDRAAFVPFPSPTLLVGPGVDENVLVVGYGSAGPDRPQALHFWHARDVTHIRTASPSGQVPWEGASEPMVSPPLRASTDGALILLIVKEVHGVDSTNSYGVILGCLP
jgi:hypothetical protein